MFFKIGVLKHFAIFAEEPSSPGTLFKRDSNTDVSSKHFEIFKNSYFEEHLWAAAYGLYLQNTIGGCFW